MQTLLSNYLVYLSLAVLSLGSCGTTKKAIDLDKVVASYYLVRHAEKVDDSRDPGLTNEGKERAYFLAEYLKEVELSTVYSTDYFRTRLTGQPSSSLRNIDLTLYDAGELEEFSNQILLNHKADNVLIVGHSNTTPDLAAYLCPSADTFEIVHWEYDKLFRVDYLTDGSCSCTRINFGKTSTEQ